MNIDFVILLIVLLIWAVASEIVRGRRHSRTLKTIRSEVHSLRTQLNAYGVPKAGD